MAFGADRTVSVTLKAKVQEYLGPLDQAKNATEDFGKKTADVAAKHKTATRDLGLGMAAAGAVIAGGIGLAIKSFADFDKELSNVRAVSGATAGDMDKLKLAALDAGAATKFSASDAAQAEAELVKAGISVNDVLNGGLNGALALAAAGNLDLANAATISANAMNIFGLKGSDVGTIADTLAAGANKSAADVNDLGQALAQSGLIASQMGLNLQDTTGVLAAFADNGLKGSDAGTSFKTMLQRLVPTSVAAATAMEDIGFSAYDAQGNLKSIDQVAQNLQDSMKGLTQKQRDQTLATIFGSDAVRGANVLFKLGSAGVKDYTAAVKDNGAAARVAATQMDNLAGDVENLRGSIDTALIKGGSGANDALRSLTGAATGAVNAFSDLPDSVQSSVVGFAAFASGALLLGGGLITAVPKIKATRDALNELAAASPRAGEALGKVGAVGVMAAMAAATAAAANQIRDMGAASSVASPATDKLAQSLLAVSSGAKDAGTFGTLFATGLGPDAAKTFSNTSDAIKDFGANAKAALNPEFYEKAFGTADQAASVFRTRVEQIDKALVQLVQSGHGDQAAKIVDQLAQSTVQFGGDAEKVRGSFTGYAAALDSAAVAGGKYADSTAAFSAAQSGATGGGRLLSDEIDKQRQSAENAQKAYDKLTDSVKSYGNQVAGALSASAGYEASIDNAAKVAKDRAEAQDALAQFDKDAAAERKRLQDAIKKAGTKEEKASLQGQLDKVGDPKARQRLIDQIEQYAKTLDISTEAGRRNQAMLLDIATNAKNSAVENFKNGESVADVQKKMEGARGAFVQQAQDFGATKDEAEKLADKLGLTKTNLDQLATAADVKKTVTADTSQADANLHSLTRQLEQIAATPTTAYIDLKYRTVGPSAEAIAAMANGTMGPVGFATGGFTGFGGKYEPAGVVHRGEYVFTKEETSKAGVATLAAYARSLRGYADGGLVASAMSSGGGSVGGAVTHDNRMYVDKLQGPTVAEIQREADRKRRLHALRGRRA